MFKKSIRKLVISVCGVVLVLLIGLYSLIGLVMLEEGTDLALVWVMDEVAGHYARHDGAFDTFPLLEDERFRAGLSVEDFPPGIRESLAPLVKKPGVTEFIHSDDSFYIAGMWPMEDGKQLILLYGPDEEEDIPEPVMQLLLEIIEDIGFIFALSLVVAMVVIALMTYRMIRPIRKLEQWANRLSLENMNEPLPSFTYKELDAVAVPLQQAFQRIDEMLSKEQFLLRTTSHELRTPIAVVATNVELLQRIVNRHPLPDEGNVTIQRIQRTAQNMKELTETILWLGRDGEEVLPEERLDLDFLLEELVEVNRYLIDGKQVDMHLDIRASQAMAAYTPCQMVISNLLRNAMQYTFQGDIHIRVQDNRICISNQNRTEHTFDKTTLDYGYGLGLALVERICQRMGWSYVNEEIAGGRQVEVVFEARPTIDEMSPGRLTLR